MEVEKRGREWQAKNESSSYDIEEELQLERMLKEKDFELKKLQKEISEAKRVPINESYEVKTDDSVYYLSLLLL